jgi:hypothetical protein
MLKTWTMVVSLDNSVSSVPLYARCIQTAVAMAAKEIASRSVSDKRFAEGKIEIKDPDNNVVYLIPQLGQGKAMFVTKEVKREEKVNA